MPNTFLTVQQIAMESLLRLQNNLVMLPLVHTNYSSEFKNQGDTVQIKKPATFTAKDFTDSIDVQGISESNVLVSLDKISDISVEVTSKELSLNIDAFGKQVIDGAMQALAQKIDAEICGLYSDIPYFAGTAGTTPSKLSDISVVRKILNNNKVPFSDRRLVLDTEADAKFAASPEFANVAAAGDTAALKEANLGRKLGFDIFMDQNIKTHKAGGYAAATTVVATGTAGQNTVALSATAGTGSLLKGDILSINGLQYTVTETTANATTNAIATVKVCPALATDLSSVATTILASHVSSLAFHKNAFAFVNRPQALPLGGASGYIAEYNGLSIRVTQGYDMKSKKNTISFDILYGLKTLDPRLAARFVG